MELEQLHTEDNELAVGFAESRIGGRTENQDSYGALQTRHGFLVTVCDGMGGGPAGKTASSMAVREIMAGVEEADGEEDMTALIAGAVQRANRAIWQQGQEYPELRGMGTTATVLLLSRQAAYVAHVGDSRIYQLRGHSRVFRTGDHSVVAQLVRSKVITEEQARLSAQSNIITRALGIRPDVEVDTAVLPYEKGDRFMLCTDGVHGSMPEKELLKLVTRTNCVLGALVDDMATVVDNLGRNSGGGHDNLTLAVVETKKNSILKSKMSRKAKLMGGVLSAVCVASIVLNVAQAGQGKAFGTPVPADSVCVLKQEVSVYKDSVRLLKDSITVLKKMNGKNNNK